MSTSFKNTTKRTALAVLAAVMLSGCYHHGGYAYRDYDRYDRYGGGYYDRYASSVEGAESLRSRVLNSRPSGGHFTERTFNNSVSAGSDSWRYRLDGRGRGVILGE